MYRFLCFVKNNKFLVFSIIVLFTIVCIILNLYNLKEENFSETQNTVKKNYYIYCYMGGGIDSFIQPEEGYFLQYSNKFLKECSESKTGYGNVYVKDGYTASLSHEYVTPSVAVYSVSNVTLNRYDHP